MMNYDEALFESEMRQALEMARKQRPEFDYRRHAAFANAVLTLVHGVSAGLGGPSVREHAALLLYMDRRFSFEEAVRVLIDINGVIFGPLSDVHFVCWQREYCFNDDPEDERKLSVYPKRQLVMKNLLLVGE